MEKEFYVIVFDSTHHAIQTEKRLKDNFQIEVIPTPREITASCGLSIKFSHREYNEIIGELLEEEGKLKIFKIEKLGNSKHATQVI